MAHKKQIMITLLLALVLACFMPGICPAQKQAYPTSDLFFDNHINDITHNSTDKINILLLNSYHQGYKWTDSVSHSIRYYLEKYELDYELHIEYLNSKRIGDPASWTSRTERLIIDYPEGFIDAIIATDDNAFNSLLACTDKSLKEVPIIFCGVSNFKPEMIEGFNNITGVVQNAEIYKTIDVARDLFPQFKHVAFITDNTETGATYRNLAKNAMNKYQGITAIWLDGCQITTPELLMKLKQLPEETIVIMGIWQRDAAGNYFQMEKIYPEISAICPRPIFTNTDLGMGYGIIGGKMTCAETQARIAVEMLTSILANPDKPIPAVLTNPILDSKFDHTQLSRWGLLQKRLPDNTILINTKRELSVEELLYLWGSIAVIIILTISLLSLLIYIRQYKKIKEEQARKDRENSVIMNSLPLWCGIIDLGGNILVSNQKKIEPTIKDIWPENHELISYAIMQASSDNTTIEVQFENKDRIFVGVARPIEFLTFNREAVVFIAHDITEKVQAQKEIQEKNELLDMAMAVGKSCYWVWNIPAEEIRTDKNFWACQGIDNIDRQTITAGEFWRNVSLSDEVDTRIKLQTLESGQENSCSIEFRLNFSGHPLWFQLRAITLQRDSTGHAVKIGAFMSNITGLKNIELKMKQSYAQLLDAQEMTSVGSWIIDKMADTVTASPEMFKIMGIPYQDNGICPRSVFRAKIVNNKELLTNLEAMNKIGDSFEYTGQIYSGENNEKIKTIWSKVRYGIDENNRPVYIGVSQDITNRVEMENELKNSEQYLLQAAALAKMYYWNYDSEKQQMQVYNSASVWGEHNIDGVLTFDSLISYIHPDDLKTVITTYRNIFGGHIPHGSISYRIIINGVVRHVNCNWECYYNEDHTLESVLGIVIDITEQKDAEQIEIARKEVEATAKAKGLFLATMSHEIRTPINVVIGMNHLLQETALDDIQQNFVTKIDRAANALLGIINDILDISKIEENKLNIENIDFSLKDIIYNNATILAVGAEKNNVEMHIRIDPEIPQRLTGDPLRISQILTNLLSNAVKFTEKGDITLNASLLRLENNNAVIEFTVTDTGIGIRKECLEKLFQPYSQAEKSTTRRFGGTGLGLAICKQLAELMDGNITAESQEGKGSSFIVQLALGIPAQNAENSSYQIPELAGKNALVVDDNHTALEIISELTISAGMVVTLASSGQEALEILTNSGKMFDLAIIDWQMPGMNGTATAREIQKCNLAREPHLIAVTSHNRENIIQDCLNNGFSSVITKPINPNELITAIRKAFGLSVHTPIRKSKDIVPNLTGTNILLVEDQELNQEIMINLLEKTQTKVTIANNGKEAVDMVQEKVFDLVLMDIEMPVMNGLEATRVIRALDNKETAGVPILAMTANAMQEDLENSKNAGMNDHITKPINPGLLYRKIRDHISRSNKESQRSSLLEQLNQIDKIDTYSGLGFAGGDKELYMKTIARFLEQTPEQIAELNLALNQNNTDSAAAAIHTIKGIAGTIGACKLKEQADITEKILLENPQEKSLEQSISDIVSELESLKTDIEKVINTPTGDIK